MQPFYLTTNAVSTAPAEPHETMIGHRPAVVLVPTIHVQEMRPLTGVFGVRPCACDEPLLYMTMIEHVRAGDTDAVSVA